MKSKVKTTITKLTNESGDVVVRVEKQEIPVPPKPPKQSKPKKVRPPKPHKVKPPKPHPKANVGACDPLRGRREIGKVERVIGDHPRNRAMFSLGMNWALRGGDLITIKLGDVRNKCVGDPVQLREEKTGNVRVLVMNENTLKVLQPLLEERKHASDEDYLFVPSINGGALKHLTREQFNKLLKRWCMDAGLPGQYSTHSLRKTFGYMLRTEQKLPLEIIQKIYGHSSSDITLRYVGITQDEVKAAYLIGI